MEAAPGVDDDGRRGEVFLDPSPRVFLRPKASILATIQIREENLDDYAACKIEKKEDFRKLFGNFYFGCEADDRMNAWAFNDRANPLGTKINAMFSSDIGHFDVEHMNEVVEEAYELVEDGIMSSDDFRDFTFTNPAHFWARGNTDFFKGTVVEKQVAELLESTEYGVPHAAGS